MGNLGGLKFKGQLFVGFMVSRSVEGWPYTVKGLNWSFSPHLDQFFFHKYIMFEVYAGKQKFYIYFVSEIF